MKTGYEPIELLRLANSLRTLRTMAEPRYPGSLMQLGGTRAVDSPLPDPAGAPWRDYLERVLYRLNREARSIECAILTGQPRHDKRRDCPNCRRKPSAGKTA